MIKNNVTRIAGLWVRNKKSGMPKWAIKLVQTEEARQGCLEARVHGMLETSLRYSSVRTDFQYLIHTGLSSKFFA